MSCLQGFGLTDYAATADAQTLANDNWGGGVVPSTTSWTIGGITRPAVSKLRAAVPPACVVELGWITPAGTKACPGRANFTDADVDVHFPSLEAVGGQALPLAYGSAEQYRAVSLDLTKEAFASVKGAVAATIDTMQVSLRCFCVWGRGAGNWDRYIARTSAVPILFYHHFIAQLLSCYTTKKLLVGLFQLPHHITGIPVSGTSLHSTSFQTGTVCSHPHPILPTPTCILSPAACCPCQASYSTALFFRNVTSKTRLKELAQLYGSSEWEPLGAEAIAAAGDLVEVDLTYLQVRVWCDGGTDRGVRGVSEEMTEGAPRS